MTGASPQKFNSVMAVRSKKEKHCQVFSQPVFTMYIALL